IYYSEGYMNIQANIMKVEAEIKQWGNSKALRLSGPMADIPHFTVGTKVTVEISKQGLVIQKRKKKTPRLPFSEEYLLAGMTPELAHADALAQPFSQEIDY